MIVYNYAVAVKDRLAPLQLMFVAANNDRLALLSVLDDLIHTRVGAEAVQDALGRLAKCRTSKGYQRLARSLQIEIVIRDMGVSV